MLERLLLAMAQELHLVRVSEWAPAMAEKGMRAFDDHITLCANGKPLGKFPRAFKRDNIELLWARRRTFSLGNPFVRLSDQEQ